MGLFSNKISRVDLEPGDHIYSWRKAYTYSHHGIYVGDGEVIHFTRGDGLKTGKETFWDNFSSLSSVQSLGGGTCRICGHHSNLDGVVRSCLDCFLSGGNLYRYKYDVWKATFTLKLRGGTCTTAPSDPSDEVISRAKALLSSNGFGDYDLLKNNCEDFAIYCKTGKVGTKGGSSGQVNSASAACKVITKFNIGAVLVPPLALGKYCKYRMRSDIGERKDVCKIPVEYLAQVWKRRLDNK